MPLDHPIPVFQHDEENAAVIAADIEFHEALPDSDPRRVPKLTILGVQKVAHRTARAGRVSQTATALRAAGVQLADGAGQSDMERALADEMVRRLAEELARAPELAALTDEEVAAALNRQHVEELEPRSRWRQMGLSPRHEDPTGMTVKAVLDAWPRVRQEVVDDPEGVGYESMPDDAAVIAALLLPRARSASHHPRAATLWGGARDLLSGEPAKPALPYAPNAVSAEHVAAARARGSR